MAKRLQNEMIDSKLNLPRQTAGTTLKERKEITYSIQYMLKQQKRITTGTM